ncbi:MAG TPA: hypothetical protein VFG03_11935 [Telluria sp.]|nr:hypothetical protein [Telluria sp.]
MRAMQKSFQQKLIAAISIAVLMPLAQAGVIDHPASIVDHGTYITDTVNQLDWYKFSNPVNTVGWSMDTWMGNALPGWSVASVNQVKGLEAQFGWTADTLVAWGDNYGLTEAMATYLGHTYSFYSGDNLDDGTFMIQAMTSDAYYFFNPATQDTDDLRYQVTTSQFFTEADGSGATLYFGDYVNSEFAFRKPGEADDPTGIWLSRASVEGGGGAGVDCGRLAPCPDNQVGEPHSVWLSLLGLGGLVAFRRSRFYQADRITEKHILV